ncbi:MAG: GPR endopeptidase [Lachnospiraceae bacterium]|nr:GPR endopeptidase [Lachnospiraceae bacterium]MDD6183714.1 GPR endopeptidase [Lachnospiraceae bacterium]MDD7377659.1 GPR endopeptidase [Lachnospiraceae bacterium]MDY4617592.1 GPR endopeptidase [Lachnospiraceae bacterium]MDY5774880.1 GPR endopeptidase [Lachnospiraceae bacterium]
MYQVRTDLALETKEKFEEDNVELKGVRVKEEERGENIKITEVVIETENGAKAMGKPKGIYTTIEAPEMADGEDGYHREISKVLAEVLKTMMPQGEKEELSILVVGLGNREVTPDALGPKVVDNMLITRHVIQEFGKYALGEEHSNLISSIVPGVMAQTGMESVEIVRGVMKEAQPDYIVAVDALAARSVKRLNRTIQITNTGINPGSGVGNHRHALNQESMGVPVIAIGIPTVVDAATIVNDAISGFYEEADCTLNSFFVTPKDIDESIKRLSFTVSEGLNLAFEKEVCPND